uniref:Uncharacterized protein n=1 Tax=Rhizophora mucronata TaxID=61149 RepID=A0A2P2MK82_RHIMU
MYGSLLICFSLSLITLVLVALATFFGYSHVVLLSFKEQDFQ